MKKTEQHHHRQNLVKTSNFYFPRNRILAEMIQEELWGLRRVLVVTTHKSMNESEKVETVAKTAVREPVSAASKNLRRTCAQQPASLIVSPRPLAKAG